MFVGLFEQPIKLCKLCRERLNGTHCFAKLGERLGSGDGERKTLLTRQIAFEPLPASVLFGLGGGLIRSECSWLIIGD